MGRFINADEPEMAILEHNVLGHNLFAYCGNNPVNLIDDFGNLAIPWQIKVGLAAGVASALWEMGKYIYINWRKKKFSWEYVKGLGAALARGFIRGFVVGLLSTIPKAWIYGLIGGCFNLIFMIIEGKVRSAGAGISAFMNGWTKGVFTKALSRLFAVLFKGCKWKSNTKDLIKFATSTLTSYGISRFFKW